MAWAIKARVAWWAKFVAMVTGAIIGISGAASILGLRFDIQTASASDTQHRQLEAMMREGDDKIRTEQSASLKEIKDAINNLGSRIDNALLIERPRRIK